MKHDVFRATRMSIGGEQTETTNQFFWRTPFSRRLVCVSFVFFSHCFHTFKETTTSQDAYDHNIICWRVKNRNSTFWANFKLIFRNYFCEENIKITTLPTVKTVTTAVLVSSCWIILKLCGCVRVIWWVHWHLLTKMNVFLGCTTVAGFPLQICTKFKQYFRNVSKTKLWSECVSIEWCYSTKNCVFIPRSIWGVCLFIFLL